MGHRSWNEEFGEALFALAEGYGVQLSELRVKLYASSLSDLPVDTLKLAMSAAVRECKFFPTSAELRALAEPTRDDAALLAWASLADAASVVGAYGSVQMDAWTAQALEDVFGSWPEYCALEDGPALALKRQEFLAAYKRARRMLSPSVRQVEGLCACSEPYALVAGGAGLKRIEP